MSRSASIKVGVHRSDDGKFPLGHLLARNAVVLFSNYLASVIRYI